MPPENPYAAPQSPLTPQPAREFDQRPHGGDRARRAVAEGTRLCLLAVWFTLGCIGVALVGVVILNLAALAGLSIILLLTCAAVCHARGLYELQGAAAETGTRGWLQLSLTTFCIAVVANILEAATKLSDMGSIGQEFNLGQTILSLTMYSSLAFALVRIARYHHEDGARWAAQVALAIIVVCYGALVLFYSAILTPAGLAWLQFLREPDGRRLGMTILVAGLALGVVGAGFYTRSLWLLHKSLRDF